MTYELAKKLKEAGFPFVHDKCNPVFCGHMGSAYCRECGEYVATGDNTCPVGNKHCGKYNIGFLVAPTLSELIEACGDRFVSVGNDRAHELWHLGGRDYTPEEQREGKNMWRAYAYWGDRGHEIGTTVDGYGNTAEEAVINLWLELNKK